MKLSQLIANTNYPDIEISGLQTNSKLVKKGDLFICIIGENFDSHDFINEAIDNGAVFAITSKDLDITIPYLKVNNTRLYSRFLYSCFYNEPQNKLKLIGVTGTDGKTSVTTIIQSLIGNDLCGYIGTNGYNCAGYQCVDHINTTPGPDTLYNVLNNFVVNDCKYATLEASSEGLYHGRLQGLKFEIGIVTNVHSDHLNVHKTLQNYVASKALLMKQSKIQILNSSDIHFEDFKKVSNNYFTYGYNPKDDLYIKDYVLNIDSTNITFVYLGNEYSFDTKLVGKFNIENICACILSLVKLNFDIPSLLNKAKDLSIPGRMNFVDNNKVIHCLLDYAHTANGLKSLFEFTSNFKLGKRIVVFGKPGHRDVSARYEIGPILEEYNDLIILTAQDARDEDIHSINSDIIRDVKDKSKFIEILDRKQAIAYAINQAKENDLVMILGKGVENGLNINGKIIEHNDLQEIKKNL